MRLSGKHELYLRDECIKVSLGPQFLHETVGVDAIVIRANLHLVESIQAADGGPIAVVGQLSDEGFGILLLSKRPHLNPIHDHRQGGNILNRRRGWGGWDRDGWDREFDRG